MKLGLFGGAFDPVHNAHLFIAEEVRVHEELDQIFFLPTRNAHHRPALHADVEHRAMMLRLAISSNPAFALDLSDTEDAATGYTADLIPRMRARHPEDELYFIAGGDSLVRSRWERLDEVLAEIDGFLVAPRGGTSEADLDTALSGVSAQLRAKVRLLPIPEAFESATLVRDRLDAGESFRYLLPEPVWRYINEHKLYTASGVSAR